MFHKVFTIVSLLIVFAFAKNTSASGDKVFVSADKITVQTERSQVFLRGEITLQAGSLKLSGQNVVLDIDQGRIEAAHPFVVNYHGYYLEGSKAQLDTKNEKLVINDPTLGLSLGKKRLTLTALKLSCANEFCHLEKAVGTLCPHIPRGYSVSASRIVIQPSGDVDLFKPVLRIGEVPIFALPWIRIRPEDKPGFLAPKLGWSSPSGFILTLGGHIPISEDVFVQGTVSPRTSQGLSTTSTLHAKNTDLNIYHLSDLPEHYLRTTLTASPSLKKAKLNLDADVSTHRAVIDDLTFYPLSRAKDRRWSRALLTIKEANFITESSFAYAQTFDRSGMAVHPDLLPVAHIFATFVPGTEKLPVWPSFGVELLRAEANRNGLDAIGDFSPPHTRISLVPSLTMPLQLGIFALQADLALHLVHWLEDRSTQSYTQNRVLSSLYFALPILKDSSSIKHLIEPFVMYRITPVSNGEKPMWVFDSTDLVQEGHGLEMGVSQKFGRTLSNPALELSVTERVSLNGFGNNSGFDFIAVLLKAGPRWLNTSLLGAYDHQIQRVSHLSTLLASHDKRGTGFESGVGWINEGSFELLNPLWRTSSESWQYLKWPLIVNETLELKEALRVTITRSVKAYAETRIGVVPAPKLLVLSYGVSVQSHCGCIVVSLDASHRMNTSAPDMMLSLRLKGF